MCRPAVAHVPGDISEEDEDPRLYCQTSITLARTALIKSFASRLIEADTVRSQQTSCGIYYDQKWFEGVSLQMRGTMCVTGLPTLDNDVPIVGLLFWGR